MENQNEIQAKKHYYLGRLYGIGTSWLECDFGSALRHFKTSAGLGNRDAMFWVGYYHLFGLSTAIDFNYALIMFLRSDNDSSRFFFAYCYSNGFGVKKDLKKAVTIYEKLSDRGYPAAAVNLGDMYYDGIGVEKNLEMAAKYYLRAAELGNVDGCRHIHFCYENGIGVEQNTEEADRWYDRWVELYVDPESLHFYNEREPVEFAEAIALFESLEKQGDEDAAYVMTEYRKSI